MKEYNTLCLSDHNAMRLIDPTLITCIHTEGNHLKLKLQHDDDLRLNKKLSDIECVLPQNLFARVHKSTIVNVRQIKRFKNGADSTLIMKDGTEVSVSRRRKSEFMDRFLRL